LISGVIALVDAAVQKDPKPKISPVHRYRAYKGAG